MVSRFPRLLGGTCVLLVVFAAFAGPAAGVEAEGEPGAESGQEIDHGSLPSLEEVLSGSDASQEMIPEPPEAPVFADALLYPLLVLGLGVSVVVLLLYLRWQPRFGREREKSGKR